MAKYSGDLVEVLVAPLEEVIGESVLDETVLDFGHVLELNRRVDSLHRRRFLHQNDRIERHQVLSEVDHSRSLVRVGDWRGDQIRLLNSTSSAKVKLAEQQGDAKIDSSPTSSPFPSNSFPFSLSPLEFSSPVRSISSHSSLLLPLSPPLPFSPNRSRITIIVLIFFVYRRVLVHQ